MYFLDNDIKAIHSEIKSEFKDKELLREIKKHLKYMRKKGYLKQYMRKTLWILTIVFVVLKLVGVVMWSWWLVLLPMIIGFLISIFIGFVVGVYKELNK